jgi:hypothetical protein
MCEAWGLNLVTTYTEEVTEALERLSLDSFIATRPFDSAFTIYIIFIGLTTKNKVFKNQIIF